MLINKVEQQFDTVYKTIDKDYIYAEEVGVLRETIEKFRLINFIAISLPSWDIILPQEKKLGPLGKVWSLIGEGSGITLLLPAWILQLIYFSVYFITFF